MTTKTTSTSKTTGWKNPQNISQYTTNVNSGACYAFTNLAGATIAGYTYAYIPNTGVNSSHRGPRVYAYNYGFNLPTNGSVTINAVHIRQRVTKGTNQGGIEDNIVRLKTSTSLSNTGNGTNRASGSNWTTKSYAYRTYSYSPNGWGLTLTRELLNSYYFGCLLQCIGTSSTWAIPWMDGIEMKIDYTHHITTVINPVYSQTQTVSKTTVQVDGQKTDLTITQKNTNNATGTFPLTTITLSSGLYFSDGTQYKTIPSISTPEGWVRTTTFTNIYATTPGSGNISIYNSIFGTKNLAITKMAAEEIIPDPAYNISVVPGMVKTIPNEFETYTPGESITLEIETNGEAYTSEHITDLSIDIPYVKIDDIIINSIDTNTAIDWVKTENIDDETIVSTSDIEVSTSHETSPTAFGFNNKTQLIFPTPWNFGENEITVRYTVNEIEHTTVLIYNIDVESAPCNADNNYKITTGHKVSVILGNNFICQGQKINTFSECRAETDTEKPFIGVVNLKQAHSLKNFSNTTNNTLIEEQYKNMLNIGKKGDYSETLPLNIIVPREDAATFQGMVDMDKPFPINTVLSAPDMDPLNHRGWVEIHKCKIEPLNPLESRIDLDVRYISRNLSVPTHITRNDRLNNTINATLADMILQQFDIDYTDLINADDLIIDPETNELQDLSDYFILGGSATLDPLYKSNAKMVLDPGDYYNYTTKNRLPNKSEINVYWSIKFDETLVDAVLTENSPEELIYNYERTIKLIDSNGNTVYEYKLSNLIWDVTEEELTGTVDILQYYENGENTQFTETITFPTGDIVDGYANQYGCTSVINFEFDDDEVTISETGTINHDNQADLIYQSPRIPVPPGDNRLRFNQTNIEDTLEDDWEDLLGSVPITTVCAFNAIDYKYTQSEVAPYTNMIASPFPLPDKALIFTRRCKDGLIYYYNFNGTNPSTYYVQPSNMYKGGCDLTTEAGTSILTERYAVNPLCMDNGLVRCVFMKNLNRVNIYLYQTPTDGSTSYDPWILITSIIVPNMGSLKASTVDDDKITINAGNTSWTIYRGHYNIDVTHKDSDLKLARKFEKIYWTDTFGDTSEDIVDPKSEYPFTTNFYHQFYNENANTGFMIIRPNKDKIEGTSILRSNKTVFIPYWKVTRERNRPAALALEWMYQYGQSIVAQGV